MNKNTKQKLIKIAESRISSEDVSHDFHHAMRVLYNAEMIAKKEKGDLDIVIPAALFHDIIIYPKNSKDSHKSQQDSATEAGIILSSIKNFPKNKIEKVKTCILECSFSKGIKPSFLESQIIQDADLLESTGAVSIMRIFSSSGQMRRVFYNSKDPFCKNRELDSLKYSIDLFYNRLFKVHDRINTNFARSSSERRTNFLRLFLEELRMELEEI